jgi:hypothetical protein
MVDGGSSRLFFEKESSQRKHLWNDDHRVMEGEHGGIEWSEARLVGPGRQSAARFPEWNPGEYK